MTTPLGAGVVDPGQGWMEPVLSTFSWFLPQWCGGWYEVQADPEICESVSPVIEAACLFLDCPDGARRPFAVQEGIGYLAALDDLLLLDLEDADQDGSMLLSQLSAAERIESLKVVDAVAYVNTRSGGSVLVDASDPRAPVIEGEHWVTDWAGRWHTDGERVFRYGLPGVEIAVLEQP